MTSKVSRLKEGCLSARVLLAQRLEHIQDTDDVVVIVRDGEGQHELFCSDGVSLGGLAVASACLQGRVIHLAKEGLYQL